MVAIFRRRCSVMYSVTMAVGSSSVSEVFCTRGICSSKPLCQLPITRRAAKVVGYTAARASFPCMRVVCMHEPLGGALQNAACKYCTLKLRVVLTGISRGSLLDAFGSSAAHGRMHARSMIK